MFIDKKIETAQILIVNDVEEALNTLLPFYSKHNIRVIKNDQKDEFQIAQAHAAIKEAYISSNEKKYLILVGRSFRNEAQNALLKVFEEPPKNIVFIIITSSKSSILPTIFSRIPHKYYKTVSKREEITLDVDKLDLKEVYLFLKDSQRITKDEARTIIEAILYKVSSKKIELNQKELELFSKSIKLLELNSRPINVLTSLLLMLLNRNKRV
ncbi:DNA polymerase III subunit delta' [Halarcobacter ebronensis]|uniref:DNA polymerase III subunit delta n=1 Tax=Halarcobacter ebronensis TaxID=1462615 RepID=A0A4Q1APP9_9BACT|nr:DNA polymerase III subunit delta' [Halarcobacter ebronensis]QKF82033.1 DNA polymerase III, delta prime subunit [Halarcobacter ebronensis]RXK04133.1 DNA polymerase III subunit delta' [Halarcobacter ebronensis]